MVVDSGEEVHLVCPAHKHLMKNVAKLADPLQLETAGGDLTLDTIGDLLRGGIVCHGCVFSLFSTPRGEKDGYFYERCPEGYGVFERTERKCEARALGWFGLPRRRRGTMCFPALLTPGSVDRGYCRMDNVDIEHLRRRHLEFDPVDDRETAGGWGEVCADLTGSLPIAYNGSEYLLVCAAQRDTFLFCQSIDE